MLKIIYTVYMMDTPTYVTYARIKKYIIYLYNRTIIILC